MRSPAHEIVQMFQQAYQSLSDTDKDSTIDAFAKMKDPAVSSVALLSTEFSSEATSASHTIALGAKHRKDVEAQMKASGKDAEFDKEAKRLFQKNMGSLYVDNDTARFEQDFEVVKSYLVGKMHESGDYKIDQYKMEDAVKKVMGNLPVSASFSG